MKKTIILSSTVILGALLVAGANAAHADEKNPLVAGSQATFEFTPADPAETNPPVDETKPVKPESGNKGPLVIDAVSKFAFESAEIKGGETKTNVKVPAGETIGIQVTDKQGSAKGWEVHAQITDFTEEKKETQILRGAYITVPAGTFYTRADGDTDNPPVAANAAGTVIGKDAASKIIFATEGKGNGSWINDWAEEVELTIPGGNLLGKYKAAITWTISAAPVVND
ncbi:hypothetical protein DOK67_0002056 [Enterococcus sp. DIV0212c]|uniref:WxL domain-containing protein n=1 Tax=Enterococcus sp. DIV0212c TaxID=2230867 RepID=UPI001A9BABD3|nr:WxL domain-containing protein [Enterococcus sp. DIV0212c]MBO1354767.1 WxL domain-containing protein [Enterococcus sp. DIV0212c]